MLRYVLLLHILGWAQWMTGQVAITGLLRRPGLFGEASGPALGAALKGLHVTLIVGAVMAVATAFWLLQITPPLWKMGFVHTKLTIGLVLIAVWLGPLRGALGRLERGEVRPLKGVWFGISLAGFIVMIALGALRPF